MVGKLQRDHVFEAELYPPSKNNSTVQRLTIPSCDECNQGFSDDETYFREILALAGDPPNAARREIWPIILRSLDKEDGPRRVREMAAAMQPIQTPEGERHKVYPGRDKRVLRVVRKIVRGLCHYHHIDTGVAESRVTVEILTYRPPPELLSAMNYDHREPDIAEYWYSVWDDDDTTPVLATFLLRFYERTPFMAWVAKKTGPVAP
jgi:hypothetical protein